MTVTSSISATFSFASSSLDNNSSNSLPQIQTISFTSSNSEREELENVRKLQSKLNEIITETIKRNSTCADLLDVEVDNSDEDLEDEQ